MKKLNIFLVKTLALFMLLFSVGCNDFLELSPESSWDIDDFYSSETEAELALAGIYGDFASDALFGNNIIHFDSGTDEGYYNRRWNDGWPVGLYRHTPAEGVIKDFWTKLYSAINHCNIFEEKLNGDLTEEEKNRLLGEVRFLRAFAYFNLVQWFEDVPMPLKYTKDLTANHLAASPQKQVYEQIIKDFEFAAKYLIHPADADYIKGRAHKMAAHGMLARVYMKMAGYPLKEVDKYQLAKNQCDSVIMDGYHALTIEANGMGYRKHFLSYIQDQYDSKESLFEISFSFLRDAGIDADGRHGNMNGLEFSYGGSNAGYPQAYAMLTVSPVVSEVYAKYEKDKRREWNVPMMTYTVNGDARRISNELERGNCPGKFRRWEPLNMADLDNDLVDGNTEPYVLLESNKSPQKNFTGINFPILRYADILLMYAEADNEINNGPTVTAIEYLDAVRNRAGLDPISVDDALAISSKDLFFKELVDERLREFCFEGLRKMDLIRWELLGDRLQYQDAIIKGHSSYKAADGNHQAWLRPSNYFDPAYHLSLPYPSQEVEINQQLEQKSNWQ